MLVLREIEATLEKERGKREGRAAFIGVHGNRLIAHLVYQALRGGSLSNQQTDMDALLPTVSTLVADKYQAVVDVIEACYPTNYLASLFKNASRCRDIASRAQPQDGGES